MEDIAFPSSFNELTSKSTGFFVENSVDLLSYSRDEQNDTIREAISLEGKDSASIDQNQINTIFAAIESFGELDLESRSTLIAGMCEISGQMLDFASQPGLDIDSKNSIKVVIYFLEQLAMKGELFIAANKSGDANSSSAANTDDFGDDAEFSSAAPKKKPTKGKAATTSKKGVKSQSGGSLDWARWRYSIIEILERSVSADCIEIWSMGIIPENFIRGIWKYMVLLLETKPQGMSGSGAADVAARDSCIKLIVNCVKTFGSINSTGSYAALSSAIIDSLTKYEHMSSIAAEIASLSNSANQNGKVFVTELMNEIANMNMAIPSVKNIGNFLELFAKANPVAMASYLPILRCLIDCQAHQIRSSVITAVGFVIVHISQVCSSNCGHNSDMADILSSEGLDAFESKDDQMSKKSSTSSKDKKKNKSKKPHDDDDEEEEEEDECVVEDDLEEKEEDEIANMDTAVADGNSRVTEVDETKNREQLMRLRDSLLEIMTERVHDKSPYTRSSVLKVWATLIEERAIPVRKVGEVAELACDRLVDKTANVRKNSVALLTCLLENNPFGGVLDIDIYLEQKKQIEELLVARFEELKEKYLGTQTISVSKELGSIAESDEDAEEKEFQNAMAEVETEEFMKSAEVTEDVQISGYKATLECCATVLKFLAAISSSMSVLEILLTSTTNSDVIEALRFFARAVNFGVKGSASSLRRAFCLVWHQDTGVKNECLVAFSAVYLTDGAVDGTPSPLSAVEMAENLVQLLLRCDETELTSLEKIIGEVFRQANAPVTTDKLVEAIKFSPDFDVNVIQALWSSVSAHNSKRHQLQSSSLDELENDPVQQQADARHLGATLHIIGMITKLSPHLLTPSRIRLIDQCVFSSQNKQRENCVLRSACICLQSATPYISISTAPSTDDKLTEYRQALLCVSAGIRDILLGAYCGDSEELTSEWFSTCEEAMHALYHIHPSPDKVFASVIPPLYQSLSDSGSAGAHGSKPNGNAKIFCKPARLARFLFIIGQGALCSLVFIEKIAQLSKVAKARANELASVTAAKASKGKQQHADDQQDGSEAMEEQMGLAASVDAEHDMHYSHVVENQLVLDNLLSKFVPLVSFVVANQRGAFSHPLLRKTSILALCRMMSISNSLCETQLPLLFTVMDKEPNEFIRTTTIIALADLAFRFPNALEPWNAQLYSKLNDKSELVRYNTLTVLTHLVLNDMIKVKGQVTNIVVCLSDSSPKIRDLAKLFFTKLSDRSNNPVYNLLGDIIANLSMDSSTAPSSSSASSVSSSVDDLLPSDPNEPIISKESSSCAAFADDSAGVSVALVETSIITPHRSLSKAEFQSTMSFMLSFVKKDKQADALVERLVLRLGMATSSKQRRYISYCISQLSITDKGVKRMIELVKNFKSALYDDEVFGHIFAVVHKVKKTVKIGAEVKGAIDEFEALLQSIRSDSDGRPAVPDLGQSEGPANDDGDDAQKIVGANNSDDDESQRPSTTSKVLKRGGKQKVKSGSKTNGKPKSKKVVSSSDEEDDDDNDEISEMDEENCFSQPRVSSKEASTFPGKVKSSQRRHIVSDAEDEFNSDDENNCSANVLSSKHLPEKKSSRSGAKAAAGANSMSVKKEMSTGSKTLATEKKARTVLKTRK